MLFLGFWGYQPTAPAPDQSTAWERQSWAPSTDTNLTEACVADSDPEVDYFPDNVNLGYAERFRVSYRGHCKALRTNVASSEWGSDVSDTVVLGQCGTPPLEGKPAGAANVETPIRSLASNEDGSIAHAKELGYVDRVVGVACGGIYDATLRQRWEEGKPISAGESFHGAPDYEVLVANRSGVVFLFSSSLAHAEALGRGHAPGLATAPIAAWGEPTIPGQAEWINHTALFLNAATEATACFDGVAQRYLDLTSRLATLSERPTVIWGGPLGNGGRWWIEARTWMAQAHADAGGHNPFTPESGGTAITLSTEIILERATNARYWLTDHIVLQTLGAGAPLEVIPAFREGRVVHVHKRALPEHDAYRLVRNRARTARRGPAGLGFSPSSPPCSWSCLVLSATDPGYTTVICP